MAHMSKLVGIVALTTVSLFPVNLEAKLTITNYEAPVEAPSLLYNIIPRDRAIELLEEAKQSLSQGKSNDALNILKNSVAFFKENKEHGGDLKYVEATFYLGRLFYDIGTSAVATRENNKTRFLKSAVEYLKLSQDEHELYVENNPQKKANEGMVHYLVALNYMLANSYLKLDDLKNASSYALEALKFNPTEENINSFVNLASWVSDSDLKALLEKIKASFDERKSNKIINKIKKFRKKLRIH